jgi:hypothetical protein
MTPKEKAEELFQFYLPFVSGLGNIDNIKYRCKQCALIAVDEIINIACDVSDYDKSVTKSYWIEVKQEIEAL